VAITVKVDAATAARFVAYCAAKDTSQAQAFTAWVRRLPNAKIRDAGERATPPL
jgi:hypothetical protein